MNALSETGACNRLRIACLVDMSDEESDALDLEDLLASADEYLAQLCQRGLPDATMREAVGMAYRAENVAKLKKLVAILEKKIRTHDSAPGPAATSVAALRPGISTGSSAAVPTKRKADGPPPAGCTLCTGPRAAGHRPAASLERALGEPAPLSPAMAALREFAFTKGRELFLAGKLRDKVSCASVIAAFEQQHPDLQLEGAVKSKFIRDEWIAAVTNNDISLFTLRRPRGRVVEAITLAEKMAVLPRLVPMVEWVMQWIRHERAARRTPDRIQLYAAWDRERAEHPATPPFNGLHPRTAGNNYGVSWQMYSDYDTAQQRAGMMGAGGGGAERSAGAGHGFEEDGSSGGIWASGSSCGPV